MNEAARTFSTGSNAYARIRPGYPPELIDWVVSHCLERGTAWDCATGTGQAALALAQRFERVEATDISAEQLAAAPPAENINYSVQPAERTGFPDSSFDLVTVAQALHWFDLDAFWSEVRRVAKPGAFFAAWGYGWAECDPDLDREFIAPVRRIVDRFWAANNGLLTRGYRTDEIRFPFRRMEAPCFSLRGHWTIEDAIAFVHTWSAYKLAAADPQIAGELGRVEQAAEKRLAGREFGFESEIYIAAGRVS